jgi:hypothetical protein
MGRHPQLSFRQPHDKWRPRGQVSVGTELSKLFNLLERIVEHKVNVIRVYVYDVDDTALTTFKKNRKSDMKMWSIWSAKIGTITTVCCVSARGCYAPSMMIYKTTRACEDLKSGAQPRLFLHSTLTAVMPAKNIISTKCNTVYEYIFSYIMLTLHWWKKWGLFIVPYCYEWSSRKA